MKTNFADASNYEDKRSDVRMICPVDQHRPHEPDENTPVAHDDLGQRAVQRFSER